MEPVITSYCKIKNNTVSVNGDLFLKHENKAQIDFLAECYKKLELNYPKFFKMDKLCKLAILASELVIRDTTDFAGIPKDKIALVFANTASSLDSDRNHLTAIADKQHYFPSPSVFVYTLPNILLGEIAIKHKITGENVFFISEHFDAKLLHSYGSLLLKNETVSALLCGWINVDGDDAEAFVYCVKNPIFKQENQAFRQDHTPENIYYLYNS